MKVNTKFKPYAPSDTAHLSLPVELDAQRLDVRVPLGAARYLPRTHNELLASVFATWNVLDALMHVKEPGSAFQTGYLRELQVRRMMQLISAPRVNYYCEVPTPRLQEPGT